MVFAVFVLFLKTKKVRGVFPLTTNLKLSLKFKQIVSKHNEMLLNPPQTKLH